MSLKICLLVCAGVIISPFRPLEAPEVAEAGPLARALSLVPAMGTSAMRSARTHHKIMHWPRSFNGRDGYSYTLCLVVAHQTTQIVTIGRAAPKIDRDRYTFKRACFPRSRLRAPHTRGGGGFEGNKRVFLGEQECSFVFLTP